MKRAFLALAFLLCFSLLSHAQGYSSATGWCEAGAQTVSTSGLQSTTQVQASYPGCFVTVYIHGGGVATIYADTVGTPLANPFQASSNGQWVFFAANNFYDVNISAATLYPSVTLSNIIVGLPPIIVSSETFEGTNYFTGLNTFGALGTIQASQVGTVLPNFIQTLNNTSGYYLNNPDIYISRIDTTTNASCLVGLIDACAAPVARIDVSVPNTGLTDTPLGLLINMWGIQGVTPIGGKGGAVVGLGAVVADVLGETGNTDLRGMNPNVVVQGVSSTLDRNGFTRSAFSVESDITNNGGIDCLFLSNSGSGNYCGALSAVAAGANNSTVGLAVATSASPGKGWLTGIFINGAVNASLVLDKANNVATSTGVLSATGGTYGFAVGGTSITPPTNITDTLVPPTVGMIFEPKAQLSNGDSISEVFRVFASDTSHVNEWQVNARNATTSLRWAFGSNCSFTIGPNPSPCGSYTDVAAVASNGTLEATGAICAEQVLSGSNGICLEGTPTAARAVLLPDGNSATVLVSALTTTSASSDNVTIQGMTSSGHCQLTPTSSSAATNYTTTYVSAKAANQITVTHTTTSGMTFDIYCTAN